MYISFCLSAACPAERDKGKKILKILYILSKYKIIR